MKGIKTLPLLLCLSLGYLCSCQDSIVEPTDESASQQSINQVPNAEISLDLSLDESEHQDLNEQVRSFNIQAGTGGRSRPHIAISANKTFPAHLIFAYTDVDRQGNPTGQATVLSNKPVAITLRAKTNKIAGRAYNSGLEAINVSFNLPEIESKHNKAWFVMGVVGATLKDGLLQFDPNNAFMGKNNDYVVTGTTKENVGIPYTFPWKRIYFRKEGKRTRGALSGLMLRPRGLFLRFEVSNETNRGVYILEKVNIPAGQGYSPRAALNFDGLGLQQLTQGQEVGFKTLATGTSSYAFKHETQKITIITGVNALNETTTGELDVDVYTHYIGTGNVANLSIGTPRPKTPGFFWLWFADVQKGTNTLNMDIIGDPLGTLHPRQRYRLSRVGIPSDKVGYTAARTLKVAKGRPYIPLEFVSRGNVARSGYRTDDQYGFEVGPKSGKAGTTLVSNWYGGGSFGEDNVYDIWALDGRTYKLVLKDQFRQHPNRYIPTVNDWRTVIPIFRMPVPFDDIAFQYESTTNSVATEASKESIVKRNGNYRVFGGASQSLINVTGQRHEVSRFRQVGGGYHDETTRATYVRVNEHQIIGLRWLRENIRNNDEERRKYFSAYRLTYKPGVHNEGGLRAEAVYIGNERIRSGSAVEDEAAWLKEIQKPEYWKEKEISGELIIRNFPHGGFDNPGRGNVMDKVTRYYTMNRWGNDRGWRAIKGHYNPILTFQFTVNGQGIFFEPIYHSRSANNMLLRYWLVDPAKAYEEWGSRN